MPESLSACAPSTLSGAGVLFPRVHLVAGLSTFGYISTGGIFVLPASSRRFNSLKGIDSDVYSLVKGRTGTSWYHGGDI